MAQSTNLLSSSSASIRWKAYDGDISFMFFLFRMAVMMNSETKGDMFRAITSEYYSIISFVIHRTYLPSRKSCHT